MRELASPPWRFAMRRIAAAARRGVTVGVFALLCGGASGVLANGIDDEGVNRFTVIRTAKHLIRVDTWTGQIWLVPPNGDGGWLRVGGPVPDDGPTSDGRYEVKAVAPAPANRVLGGEPPPLELIRMDLESGRVWSTLAVASAEWNEISGSPAPQGTP